MRISCLGSNFPDEWPRWFTRKISELQKNLESSPWTSLWLQWVYFYYFASRLAYHRKEVSKGSYHRFCEKGVSITSQTQSLKDWANNDILQSPAFLLVTGLLKGKPNSFGTRSLNHPRCHHPRWTTIGHSSTWRRLQYFWSQMNPIR